MGSTKTEKIIEGVQDFSAFHRIPSATAATSRGHPTHPHATPGNPHGFELRILGPFRCGIPTHEASGQCARVSHGLKAMESHEGAGSWGDSTKSTSEL